MRRATALIDLAALEHNCALIKSKIGDRELAAVVKADGYGHGAVPVARAALAGGASWLAVVSANEAVEIREAGIDVPLLVMGPLSDEELRPALSAQADVVIWSQRSVRAVEGIARELGLTARVHVKLDSGMGRFGTRDPDEGLQVARLIAASSSLELIGGMTHFATADDPESGFLAEQNERFTRFAERLRAEFPSVLIHAANSAATFAMPEAHFDLVRCGVSIYGMDPFGKDPSTLGLKPVLTLRSYIAEIKPCGVGESVGYGRRFIAEEQTNIALLPIGYGDGVRRSLTNNCEVLIGGDRYRLVGTVSMDSVAVDVGPQPNVEIGQAATLIGYEGNESVLTEELAERLGTINYEITCGITARVPRIYCYGGS